MSLDYSPQSIRRAKREALVRARKATLGTSPNWEQNYSILSSGLSRYEKTLWNRQNGLLDTAKEMHTRHPERPVRILDFGAGRNVMLRDAVGKSRVPIEGTGMGAGDIRTPDEKQFDKQHRIYFINVPAPAVPLESNYYDIIVSQTTFMHLYDPLQELRRLYQAAALGGELRLSIPLYFLAAKFTTDDATLENEHVEKQAIGKAKRVFQLLAKSGIDLEYVHGNTLVIRKNEVPMKFPWIKYHEPDEDGHGLYELVA